MNNRNFFDKKIGRETESYYPDKITIEKFVIMLKSKLPIFELNLKNLKDFDNERYVEEWMQIFLAWAEIENE